MESVPACNGSRDRRRRRDIRLRAIAARRGRRVRRGPRGRHPGGGRRHPQRRGRHHRHAAARTSRGSHRHVRRTQTRHALGDCGQSNSSTSGGAPATHLLGFEAADVRKRWPVPGPRDDKYTQGVTGILAGSATYPGAAVLDTGAAVQPPPVWSAMREALPHKTFALAGSHRLADRRVGRASTRLGRRTRDRHRRRRRRRAVVRAGHRPAGDRRGRRADHPGRSPRRRRVAVRADGADAACGGVRAAAGSPPGDDRVGATRRLPTSSARPCC